MKIIIGVILLSIAYVISFPLTLFAIAWSFAEQRASDLMTWIEER